jgi:hypothetical protein
MNEIKKARRFLQLFRDKLKRADSKDTARSNKNMTKKQQLYLFKRTIEKNYCFISSTAVIK